MKRNKYYRNKYLIGIYKYYPNDDSLVALLDNNQQFAEFMEITDDDSNVILHKAFNKKIEFINYKNMRCEIVFINVEE